MTYRELREELDKIVEFMEDPDLDIDTATKNFEKADKLIQQLEKMLHEKKKQLEISIKKIK